METQLEDQCDAFLKKLDRHYLELETAQGFRPLKVRDLMDTVGIAENDIGRVLSVLVGEGFIENIEFPLTIMDKHLIEPRITTKGRHFINTDCFIDRKKRWTTERKQNIFIYKWRWLTWILSLLAILISICSYLKTAVK